MTEKRSKKYPIFKPEKRCPEYQGVDDGQLIERWKKGDKKAYDEFVKRYGAWVYNNVHYNYNIPPEDSEDVTQEVFIRLLEVSKKGIFNRKTKKYKEFKIKRKSAKGVLAREKYFRSIDWHRKYKEEKQLITSIYDSLQSSSLKDKEEKLIDTIENWRAINPIDKIIQREESKIIQKVVQIALEWMPEFCREFIKLFFLKELSYEEISKKTGIPKGTLGSKSHRCVPEYRKRLAKILLQIGIDRDYFLKYV